MPLLGMKRKAPSSSSNLNTVFCEALTELAEWEKNVNRNQFKSNAYRKASAAIASLDYRLTSGEEAKRIPGVGNKIAEKIEEIIHTGKLRKLEHIRQDDETTVVNIFNSVVGIGPAKAKELYDTGCRSLADLYNNLEKLTSAQQIGLKHVEDFQLRIPREEVTRIFSVLKEKVSLLDTDYMFEVCGSYRRGAETSGDIDVLLTHKKLDISYSSNLPAHQKGIQYLHSVVDKLTKDGLITDTLSEGEQKFMGVCRIDKHYRRLDIRLLPAEHYFCGLLYFTGSDIFNQKMRAHAVQKGFTSNEYSLRPLLHGKPQEPLPVSSEEDIFDYIDYPYKDPIDRI